MFGLAISRLRSVGVALHLYVLGERVPYVSYVLHAGPMGVPKGDGEKIEEPTCPLSNPESKR